MHMCVPKTEPATLPSFFTATSTLAAFWGNTYGTKLFLLGEMTFFPLSLFFKFNVLQGRCLVDKRREIIVHFQRTLLEWSCHPVLPIFFQLSSSLLESNVFLGWQTAQVGYFAHIL